jgi:hypothetical protein
LSKKLITRVDMGYMVTSAMSSFTKMLLSKEQKKEVQKTTTFKLAYDDILDQLDTEHIMVRVEKVNVHGKVSRVVEKWHKDTIGARLSYKNDKTSYHEMITSKYIRLFFDIDDYEIGVDQITIDKIISEQLGFLPKKLILPSTGGKNSMHVYYDVVLSLSHARYLAQLIHKEIAGVDL